MIKIFDAKDECLHDVIDFIEDELNNHDCAMKTVMMISVVVEEIFINIAHYAYVNNDGQASVDVSFDDDNVIIQFIDSGIAFNPLEKEDPDITASAEERDIGGLGIFMMKKTMDDITYERKDNKNILTMKKGLK